MANQLSRELRGGDVTPELLQKIEALGEELQGRLQWVARTGSLLLDHGWDGYGLLYDMEFLKQIPIGQAEEELKAIGLNLDELNLEEEELDEDCGG